MKKICLFLALALLCAGAAFGQSGKKNALSVDVAPLFRGFVAGHDDDPEIKYLGAGVFYERLLGSRYSLGGRFDFIHGKYSLGPVEGDITYLAGSIHGRVYPLSQGLEKFYLDTGIGFNSIDIDVPAHNKKGGGMTFALQIGYKQFFNGMIFVEPSIAFVYAETISSTNTTLSFSGLRDPSPFEWTPGLLIGVSF
ncbi:MAG: hypothetical protein LBK63_07570 [Treponema sp.]|nr:hypothetical protein [Treponema sp.]